MRKGAKLRSKFMLRKHRDGTICASIAATRARLGLQSNIDLADRFDPSRAGP